MRKFICTIALCAASVSVAHADQLIFSADKSGGSRVAAIDYVSNGDAVAFQFNINVPGGTEASVNLKSCVAALPKSHAGQCSFAKGQIIGIVYSDTNELLPKGVINVGTVSVQSKVAGDLAVASFVAVNREGAPIESNVAGSATK
jgi:hypothetical protein